MERKLLSERCRKALVLAMLSVATAVLPASLVAAASKPRPLVYDCDEHSVVSARDMTSEQAGILRFRQINAGAPIVGVPRYTGLQNDIKFCRRGVQ